MSLEASNFNSAGVFLNYVVASPPFELHASLISDLLKNDISVTVYKCDASLPACTANPSGCRLICSFCKDQQKRVISEFESINVVTIPSFQDQPDLELPATNFSTLAAMSSVASITRSVNEHELNKTWLNHLYALERASSYLYGFFSKEILEKNFDLMTCFNGRFAEAKPIVEAAKNVGANFCVVEVKKSEKELCFINESIHSIDSNTKRAISYYLEDSERAKDLAERFFSNKLANIATGDPVFTSEQQRGLLPTYYSANKKYVVVYTSSDDEYKFIGAEWDGFVPESQVSEIRDLAETLKGHDFNIIVKMHPNQAATAGNQIESYSNLAREFECLHVELPVSKVDTYALLANASVVVNFASTVGVEACYAGKVVINIGDTTFSRMRVGYRVTSGHAAARLILTENLKARSKRGAVIWGAYLMGYRSGLGSFGRRADGSYTFNGVFYNHKTFRYYLQLPCRALLNFSKPGRGRFLSVIHSVKRVWRSIF